MKKKYYQQSINCLAMIMLSMSFMWDSSMAAEGEPEDSLNTINTLTQTDKVVMKKTVELEPIAPFTQIKLGGRDSGITTRSSDTVSLNDDHPFSLKTHIWVTKELQCTDEINKGHYNQDIIMQPFSKAHFDNCEFEGSLDYIQELIMEVKAASTKKQYQKAHRFLGKTIHALQDFYAHSNYIELMEKKHPNNFDDVPTLKLWTDAGRKEVLRMSQLNNKNEKLVSGYVFWGFPQNKCPTWVASHGDLAKDSHSMTNGLVRISGWNKMTRFQTARALAAKETKHFLKETLGEWKGLKNSCGNAVSFLNILDQRVEKKEQSEK